ncbi:MAG: phosphatidate cytidylyltransferase, partial [Prevotella sp.]|nr:phosphatidate cytidylyltransferase [Prevotella sp.]
MSDKTKNLITRSISGIIFLAIMIVGMTLRPDAFIFLFTLITGLTIWEYSGLVNELEDVTTNRLIST